MLYKGSIKKNMKFTNNKKSRVERKINVDNELVKLDFILDWNSDDSLVIRQKKIREKKGTNTRDGSRQEVKKDESTENKSTSTSFIVKIIKEVLNFYRKPNMNVYRFYMTNYWRIAR